MIPTEPLSLDHRHRPARARRRAGRGADHKSELVLARVREQQRSFRAEPVGGRLLPLKRLVHWFVASTFDRQAKVVEALLPALEAMRAELVALRREVAELRARGRRRVPRRPGASRATAMLAACTIASNNYLAFAAVFAESYRRHHPGRRGLRLRRRPPAPGASTTRSLPFRVVFAHELGIRELRQLRLPLRRPRAQHRGQALVPAPPARPDRAATGSPTSIPTSRSTTGSVEVEAALARAPLALTPHILAPLDNVLRPSERQIRMTGIFNLGFVALRLDRSTAAFLDWWHERLERFCLVDPWHGLFVDQSWMDFAPAFFDDVAILREPRLNVAYWNLAQRPLRQAATGWRIGERALGFFHFSGIDLDDVETVSRHQNRIRSASGPSSPSCSPGIGGPCSPPTTSGCARSPTATPSSTTARGRCRSSCGGCCCGSIRTAAAGPIPSTARARTGSSPGSANRSLRRPAHPRRARALGEPPRAGRPLPRSCAPGPARFRRLARRGAQRARRGEVCRGAGRGRARESAAPHRVPYQQEPYRNFLHLTRPERPEALEAIDLASPREWRAWLIEPFPGAGPERPSLTRLGMLLWEKHRPLQRALPRSARPRSRRSRALAGAARRGLSSTWSESWRSAVGRPRDAPAARVRLRERKRRAPATPGGADAAPAGGLSRRPSASRSSSRGVRSGGRAPGARPARRARRSRAAARRDRPRPRLAGAVGRRLLVRGGRALAGDDHPPPPAPRALAVRLAAGARDPGGRRIGDPTGVPGVRRAYRARLSSGPRSGCLRAPRRGARRRFAGAGALGSPRAARPRRGRARTGAWHRSRALGRPLPAGDPLQLEDPWTLLAALGHLARSRPELSWSLDLHLEGFDDAGNPASAGAETVAALAEQAAGLPVGWCSRVAAPTSPRALAGACGLLVCSRSGAFDPESVSAAARGLPLAAPRRAPGSIWWTRRRLSVAGARGRLGRSAGPLPGSARVPEVDPRGRRRCSRRSPPIPWRLTAARAVAPAGPRSSTAARRPRGGLVELDRLREARLRPVPRRRLWPQVHPRPVARSVPLQRNACHHCGMAVIARPPFRRRRRPLLALRCRRRRGGAGGRPLRYVATSGTVRAMSPRPRPAGRPYAVNQAAATGDEIRVAGGRTREPTRAPVSSAPTCS